MSETPDLDILVKQHYRSCVNQGVLDYVAPLLDGVCRYVREETAEGKNGMATPTPVMMVRRAPMIDVPLICRRLQRSLPETTVMEVNPYTVYTKVTEVLLLTTPVCFVMEATTEAQCLAITSLVATMNAAVDRLRFSAAQNNKPWCVAVFTDTAVSSAPLTKALNGKFTQNFRVLELARHTMSCEGLADAVACSLLDPASPLLPSPGSIKAIQKLTKTRDPKRLHDALDLWLETADFSFVVEATSCVTLEKMKGASCSAVYSTLQDLVNTRARVIYGLTDGLKIVMRKGTVGEVATLRRVVLRLWELVSQGKLEEDKVRHFKDAVALQEEDLPFLTGFTPEERGTQQDRLRRANEFLGAQITALNNCTPHLRKDWASLSLPDVPADVRSSLRIFPPAETDRNAQREVMWALRSTKSEVPTATLYQKVERQMSSRQYKKAFSREQIEEAVAVLLSHHVLRSGESGVMVTLPLVFNNEEKPVQLKKEADSMTQLSQKRLDVVSTKRGGVRKQPVEKMPESVRARNLRARRYQSNSSSAPKSDDWVCKFAGVRTETEEETPAASDNEDEASVHNDDAMEDDDIGDVEKPSSSEAQEKVVQAEEAEAEAVSSSQGEDDDKAPDTPPSIRLAQPPSDSWSNKKQPTSTSLSDLKHDLDQTTPMQARKRKRNDDTDSHQPTTVGAKRRKYSDLDSSSEYPACPKITKAPTSDNPTPGLDKPELDKDLIFACFNFLKREVPLLDEHSQITSLFSKAELLAPSLIKIRKEMKSVYQWVAWDNKRFDFYLASAFLETLRIRLKETGKYSTEQMTHAYNSLMEIGERGVIIYPRRRGQIEALGWVEEPCSITPADLSAAADQAKEYYRKIKKSAISGGIDQNKVFAGREEIDYRKAYPHDLLSFITAHFKCTKMVLCAALQTQMKKRVPFVQWVHDSPLSSLLLEVLRTAVHNDVMTADIGHYLIDSCFMEACVRDVETELPLSQSSVRPSQTPSQSGPTKQRLEWHYKPQVEEVLHAMDDDDAEFIPNKVSCSQESFGGKAQRMDEEDETCDF